MLSIEQQQRSLLAILSRRPADLRADPWLESVASSPGLRMIHEIALWWQRFQIEWQCRYTSRLMKRLGCFESYVAAHFRRHPTPPSIEGMSAQFLSSLKKHRDPLLRAVARLEIACIGSNDRPGARSRATIIYWDRDPSRVMEALDRFRELPEREPNLRYSMRLELKTSAPKIMVSCEGQNRRNKPGNAKKDPPVSC